MTIRRFPSPAGGPPFALLALILVAVFAVTRVPFFWYGPKVELSLDSQSYLDIVATLREGRWPQFIFRTPGYPVFIWLVTACVDRWLAVIFVQNLLSFLSALFLVYSVYRFRRPLALPAALAMCGFLGSSQVLIYDISLLSDSLYTSTVIAVVASLFMAFALERTAFFSLASALMALAILVRPAGAYFAVIYALVLAYVVWNHFRPRVVLGFLAPFPALLLAFCSYNASTIGQFVITPFTEANLAGSTALFWEPDPRLSSRVNRVLEGLPDSYRKSGISEDELKLVRTSWDAGRLFEIYSKAYNRLVWGAGWGSGTRFGPGGYLRNRNDIREVSLIAIRRHPGLYAKYVWVNMLVFFEGIGYKFDLYSALSYRAGGPAPGSARTSEAVAPGGGSQVAAPASPEASKPAAVPIAEYSIKRAALGWQGFHGLVFQNVLWSWAYFAVLALSLARLIQCRGRHLGAFLLVVVTLIPLGAGLVVCLVEEALDRYSYPTQFVCYLSVALLPLLWAAPGPVRAKGPLAEPAG